MDEEPDSTEASEAKPLWKRERMKAAQEKDPDVSRVMSWVQRDQKPSPKEMELKVRDGILYRQGMSGLHAVVPRELRSYVFQQMHGQAHVGGHMGRDRTYM